MGRSKKYPAMRKVHGSSIIEMVTQKDVEKMRTAGLQVKVLPSKWLDITLKPARKRRR